MKRGLHWEALADRGVRCRLCPWECRMAPGQRGICRARVNREGELVSENYGCITAAALDPIEKKPLYHFYPGSQILSFGTWGCNFQCAFCQNWQIAHGDPESRIITPEEGAALAKGYVGQGNIGIAYTYSEPMVWYEFILDTAKLAREAGLVNVLVTNGYIREEPLEELLPYIDGVNLDVKGFSERYYRKLTKGSLAPVLKTAEKIVENGVHLEVTTLLVPGENDGDEELAALVDWLAGVERRVPLHFSRYFPNYKLDAPPTPLETMERARDMAAQKLVHVYLGNAPFLGGNDTFCPQCGVLLIERMGDMTFVRNLERGCCTACGYPLYGRF